MVLYIVFTGKIILKASLLIMGKQVARLDISTGLQMTQILEKQAVQEM